MTTKFLKTKPYKTYTSLVFSCSVCVFIYGTEVLNWASSLSHGIFLFLLMINISIITAVVDYLSNKLEVDNNNEKRRYLIYSGGSTFVGLFTILLILYFF